MNHQIGGTIREYYSGLNSFGDHGWVDSDFIANYREQSQLAPTKTYEELKPDVWRKDFSDDTVVVDPMRTQRWLTDVVGVDVYNKSNLRKREFNAQGYDRALKAIEFPEPHKLFMPTSAQIDKMPKWQAHCGVYEPSRRGVYRDVRRAKQLPIHLAAKYAGVLNEKDQGDIEIEIRESNRKLLDRVFDCSGNCR